MKGKNLNNRLQVLERRCWMTPNRITGFRVVITDPEKNTRETLFIPVHRGGKNEAG